MALSKIDVANMLTGTTPVANGGTAATTLAAAGLQRPNAKPLIINGDMMVAQRGTSTASITGADVFVVDRWRLDEVADSTITMSQETLSSGNAFDNGFLKSLKVLFTTADSSVGSDQAVQLIQHVEAQDCQLFKYGTSNAVDLTLAFWYKSNVTGTHIVALDKPDSTRTTCPVEFTVSSSGTWEHKVLNFNANDTIKGSSGAIANDTGTGLRIIWNLLYGSDYASGTNGSWTQGGTGHFTTSNQQNIGGSNNNYVEVTGVQLEVGQFTSSTLPPFQHESFEENLARCQRYFQAFHPRGSGKAFGSTTAYLQVPLLKPMRSTPSYSQNAVFRITNNDTGEFTQSGNGGSFDQSDNHSGRLSGSNFSSLTDAQTIHAAPNGNVSAHFDSEL
jgi:hypothetical protein